MRVHLITCVKEKKDVPSSASSLYKGALFKKILAIAQLESDTFYILSGKYGLLNPDAIIKPYDVNLNDMTIDYQNKWSESVLLDLKKKCDLVNDHFVIYCSKTYYKNLVPYMSSYEVPMHIE